MLVLVPVAAVVSGDTTTADDEAVVADVTLSEESLATLTVVPPAPADRAVRAVAAP